MYKVKVSGTMGVPISFLSAYNPEQFEIVGKIDSGKVDEYNIANPRVDGKELFKRLAVRCVRDDKDKKDKEE